MTATPSWGVLAQASAREIATALAPLRSTLEPGRLEIATKAPWCAAFYMEPAPASDLSAAEALRSAGIEAAHLSFDRERYRVSRWNGREWAFTGEDPVVVCASAGIAVPGHEMPVRAARPHRPTRVRAVSLVENMTAAEVEAALVPSDIPDLVEDGPRGALVRKHPLADGPTYGDLSERVPARVFHVELDPEDGRFVCLQVLGGVVQSIFEIGNTWVLKNAPLVDNVEGETTAAGILRKLGISDQ